MVVEPLSNYLTLCRVKDTQRHNEVRDVLGDLAALVWNQVIKEPVVREANTLSHTPALWADLSIRGVWIP